VAPESFMTYIYTGCSKSSFNLLTLKLLGKQFKIQCLGDIKFAPNVVDNNLTTVVADPLLLTVTGSNIHVPIISVQRLLGQSVCCGVADYSHQSVRILWLQPTRLTDLLTVIFLQRHLEKRNFDTGSGHPNQRRR